MEERRHIDIDLSYRVIAALIDSGSASPCAGYLPQNMVRTLDRHEKRKQAARPATPSRQAGSWMEWMRHRDGSLPSTCNIIGQSRPRF
ncbi:hypothetical protein E4U30_000815 [Claviceps sp. LM220 group G6]|nr:hypothetical protein E4U15_005333 [Claviceps sp. LM218 group G6]KAG6097253.1 hypothetical protein E4U30_000815 [Claviceps sp. LM220 group G6]